MVESGVTGPAAPDGDYDSADEYDEDMYKGEADRQELAQLNDLDREQILAERFEKHQRRQDALLVSSTTLSLSSHPRSARTRVGCSQVRARIRAQKEQKKSGAASRQQQTRSRSQQAIATSAHRWS